MLADESSASTGRRLPEEKSNRDLWNANLQKSRMPAVIVCKQYLVLWWN